MAKTAWIFSYKLKKSVTPEEFMERTQALHDAVISKAKGFLSWEHYVQDETWTDFVLWETEEDAQNATTVGQGTAEAEAFYACIRMVTCRALISRFVKKYCGQGKAPPEGGAFDSDQAGRSSLVTSSLRSSTVRAAVSPSFRVPSSIRSATASSTLLWMQRRRGRAPYFGS